MKRQTTIQRRRKTHILTCMPTFMSIRSFFGFVLVFRLFFFFCCCCCCCCSCLMIKQYLHTFCHQRCFFVSGMFFFFFSFLFLDCTMASYLADDVLLDIEKLETMLGNSQSCHSSSSSCNSSCDSSSFNLLHPLCSSFDVRSSATTVATTMRFNGSSKIYLRQLNKLLTDIEDKQKIIMTSSSSSILKRLRSSNLLSLSSSTRSLTFTTLFSRPSIKLLSNNRLEPKTISFSQLIARSSCLPLTYSNHQTEYGCARLNEKMWVVHCREQLIKAVNDERQRTSTNKLNDVSCSYASELSFTLSTKFVTH
jgi:hypothetical protein